MVESSLLTASSCLAFVHVPYNNVACVGLCNTRSENGRTIGHRQHVGIVGFSRRRRFDESIGESGRKGQSNFVACCALGMWFVSLSRMYSRFPHKGLLNWFHNNLMIIIFLGPFSDNRIDSGQYRSRRLHSQETSSFAMGHWIEGHN